MEPLPTFTLFPDPLREKVFKESDRPCGVCKQRRGMLYEGPQYGSSPASDGAVCPWCIASGEAGKLGVFFNDGTACCYDPAAPILNDADAELVERRTPGFTTWQVNHWLACCGRPCVYLGEADSEDLQSRWKDAVPSMFAGLQYSEQEIAETVESIQREGSPAAYVFQCQVCKKLQGYWDSD